MFRLLKFIAPLFLICGHGWAANEDLHLGERILYDSDAEHLRKLRQGSLIPPVTYNLEQAERALCSKNFQTSYDYYRAACYSNDGKQSSFEQFCVEIGLLISECTIKEDWTILHNGLRGIYRDYVGLNNNEQ